MQVMGLSRRGYWLCWLLYHFLLTTVISLICAGILSSKVLPNCSFGLLFLLLWLYGLAHFGYVLLMQSFFSTPRLAAIVTTLIFFFTSFLDQAVASHALPGWHKTLGSLLPTVAVACAMRNIMVFDRSGLGLQTFNVNTEYYGHRVSTSLGLLVLSGVTMGVLGLINDSVRWDRQKEVQS